MREKHWKGSFFCLDRINLSKGPRHLAGDSLMPRLPDAWGFAQDVRSPTVLTPWNLESQDATQRSLLMSLRCLSPLHSKGHTQRGQALLVTPRLSSMVSNVWLWFSF